MAGVLLAQGDFYKDLTFRATEKGDIDCNGATVGSIIGAITGSIIGAKNAPAHGTNRLNDTLNLKIIGRHLRAIFECAKRSLEIARDVELA